MSEAWNLNSLDNNTHRIGIFGGTFDPIHKAHIHIAMAAYDELKLKKIIVLTGGNPPHKQDSFWMTDKEYRHEMTIIACQDYAMLEPSRYEMDNEGLSYTYATLEYFSKVYSEYELYFIMGEDSLFDIEDWNNPAGIMKLSHLAVARRLDDGIVKDVFKRVKYLEDKYDAKIHIMNYKMENISSTQIRQRIKMGDYCEEFLDNNVIKYIKEKGLYK